MTTTMKLDEYERLRPDRRSQVEMVIPRRERFRMLREEWEVPQSEIAASVRMAVKIKHQRRASVTHVRSDKWDEMMERASRKVTRTLLFRKSTSAQAKELEEQFEEANQRRTQWLLSMMDKETAERKALSPICVLEGEEEEEEEEDIELDVSDEDEPESTPGLDSKNEGVDIQSTFGEEDDGGESERVHISKETLVATLAVS